MNDLCDIRVKAKTKRGKFVKLDLKVNFARCKIQKKIHTRLIKIIKYNFMCKYTQMTIKLHSSKLKKIIGVRKIQRQKDEVLYVVFY